MGVLAVVESTARSYPAALPFVALGLIAGSLWAYRRRRYVIMGAALILTAGLVLLYTNGRTAEAASMGLAPGPLLAASPSGGGGPPRPGSLDLATFSSTTRLHPRFPDDFSLPATFLLEHSSGGRRHGALTVRFRFKGEGAEAARDLRDLGKKNGWSVEVLAPHRLTFRKDGRTIEAWLSYPGHSLVLDIPDSR